MMLLTQQEQAVHEEECAAQGTEGQNPTPVTQQQKLWEPAECLQHYWKLRSSKSKKSCSRIDAQIYT